MSDILLFLEPNDLYYQHLEAALIMWTKRENKSCFEEKQVTADSSGWM